MNTYNPPIVPNQLQPFLTDEVLEIHSIWSDVSAADIRQSTQVLTPEPVDLGDRIVRPVVIPGDPEAGINVFAFPHQQAWKPSTALRFLVHRAVNNPGGLTIGLPNNSFKDTYYEFSDAERAELTNGNMRPFYELQTRTVETIVKQAGGSGARVELGGYSLGGLTALGIASVESPDLNVVSVASIESPNKNRTKKELRHDFTSSGGPAEQRRAIADASLPALSSILSIPRLALDYARFGLATTKSDNSTLEMGMAHPDYIGTEARALEQYDGLMLRIGHVAGSKIFDSNHALVFRDRVQHEIYSGEGAHGHATGDNPFALALMLRTVSVR